MGFDTDRVVRQDLLESFRECICIFCADLVVPLDALQTPCGHIFCSKCITMAVTGSRPRCPNDAKPVTRAQLRPFKDANPALYRMLGRIAVKCARHKEMCTWQGDLSDVAEHEKKCSGVTHCKCCDESWERCAELETRVERAERRAMEAEEQVERARRNMLDTSLTADRLKNQLSLLEGHMKEMTQQHHSAFPPRQQKQQPSPQPPDSWEAQTGRPPPARHQPPTASSLDGGAAAPLLTPMEFPPLPAAPAGGGRAAGRKSQVAALDASVADAFRQWCEGNASKLMGRPDMTLLEFCISLPSEAEAAEYLTQYLGQSPAVTSFLSEFFRRKAGLTAAAIRQAFGVSDAVVQDRPAGAAGAGAEAGGSSSSSSSAKGAAGQSTPAKKKKNKKHTARR